MNVNNGITLEELRKKIVSEFKTIERAEDIEMLSSGKFLKNYTKTLAELRIRHDQTINVTKKTTDDIEMETV